MLASLRLVLSVAALSMGCDPLAHPSVVPDGGVDVPGDPDAAVVAPPDSASWWLSTPDGTRRLQQQPDVPLGAADPGAVLVLTVDPTVRYQEIDGFGSSLTESSAFLLAAKMTAAQRRVLLRRLFDRTSGIGLGVLRQPMGASDFSLGNYSYADTAGDDDLSDFSIAHDRVHIIPTLHQIQAINAGLRLYASPWSPPGWMKTSGSMIGGTLRPERRALYAAYFVKFLVAYAAEGLPIELITPQNEPHFSPGGYPGMFMEWDEQAVFVKEHLGPAVAASGLATRILIWDHNWNEGWYASNVLGDLAVQPYVAGAAFHCYGGEASAQSETRDLFPDFGIWMTECSSGGWIGGYAEILRRDALLVIDSMNHWARAVVKWNLVLDEAHGPTNGGCNTCIGTVQVTQASGAVLFEAEYYALGHAAKFVVPGAHRVASSTSGQGALAQVAFVNPDGAIVVLVVNPDEGAAVGFEVRTPFGAFLASIPAGAVATYFVGVQKPSLDRSGWTATASASASAGEAALAIDGDPTTRWSSRAAQAGSEWLVLDLGATRSFSALTLDAGDDERDYPRGLALEVSHDGSAWSAPVATVSPDDALSTLRFPAQQARYLRLRQTGAAAAWWTVRELELHP